MATTVVFYDGVCGLCNRLVRFLIRRDTRARLLFAPLQGAFARTVLVPQGCNPSDLDTVYAVAYPPDPPVRVLRRSRAVLHAVAELGPAWRMAAMAGRMIPLPIADAIYNAIARRRYRAFGQLDACPVPPPKWRGRFVE
jgi:predicted DCC family thiol-disulfide oxidoreductase YuxK